MRSLWHDRTPESFLRRGCRLAPEIKWDFELRDRDPPAQHATLQGQNKHDDGAKQLSPWTEAPSLGVAK
jgi:hypothetical protein